MYFFGVWDQAKGHYLRDQHGRSVDTAGPFGDWIDGYFPPRTQAGENRASIATAHPWQDDTIASLTHYRGWTILAMWDRSIDTRYACNAAFMYEGHRTTSWMWAQARESFPDIVRRLRAAPKS